ncbi:MAG: glycosyltransferase family 2 protein [Sedimentisphaerales bacterium]|nr:glycosyltransferase family 2 protein [Sedimentisphaerales bacterium]
MYKNKTVCVVVPAYNEEDLIGKVIETMPDYVDKIVVVDDTSIDNTATIVSQYAEKSNGKVVLICHDKNQGVGAAIATGYKWARDNKIFATAVMAGDAQMDPEDLPALLDPVVNGEIDYAKGNRLFTGNAWNIIPKVRYLGNSFLSLLTKIASGYWHIADSQTGYTVINLRSLELIDPDKIYKRYGMPNDLLVKLNIYNLKVRDVPIKPIYNIGEKSGIKIHKVVPKLSWLLFKCFLYRIKEKYIIRDFHPLVFFYMFGFLFDIATLILFLRLFCKWFSMSHIPPMNALAAMFSFITAVQFTLFAMWFDMEANKDLK